MEVDQVMAVLEEELGDRVDEGTREYLSNMIAEEPCSDAEALWELIGEFLVDCGVDEAEGEELCRSKLVPRLCGEKREERGEELTLKTPFTMMSLDEKKEDTVGFVDPYFGLKGANVNFNDPSISLQMSVKAAKQKNRDREMALRKMAEWKRNKKPPPPPRLHHQRVKPMDIHVQNFSVSVAGKDLLVDATLKLINGKRYGLVGRNGIGKSTLMHALARQDIPGMPKGLVFAAVEQEADHSEVSKTALENVLEVDGEREELLEEEKKLLAKANSGSASVEESARLSAIHDRLIEIDAPSAPARAGQILAGLGFTEARQHAPMNSLSGGWRMRVSLARALFAEPDVLLLDEPTNHLDLHAVAWLTSYLSTWPKTLVVVSHARDFLNDVCDEIVLFREQTLKYYKGDYDTFERVRAEDEKQHQRTMEAQNKQTAHVQKFIDRFRYNAKRAAMVQSRIKALAKLPLLEELTKDPSLNFQFEEPEQLPTPILRLDEVGFKYSQQRGADKNFHLRDISMSIDLESRIALCGANGCGKSTLLKLIVGQLEATHGYVQRHNRLRIGYFTQHHVDSLDLTVNAAQGLMAKFPEKNMTEEQARNHLGKFGITGTLSQEPLFVLSGGQKSRVALAHVALEKPHILVLDEPSNHLDLDAVQTLIAAIAEFKGGVLIVSHDAHLLQCTCDEVWHITEGTGTKFKGNVDEFKKVLLKESKRSMLLASKK